MKNKEIIKNEIIEKCLLKYRLKNKNVMNTYLFSQIEKNNLHGEDIKELLEKINFLIDTIKIQQKEELKKTLECNVDDLHVFINGIEIFE